MKKKINAHFHIYGRGGLLAMRSVCCGERDEPPSYADAVCCRGRLLATYAVWSSHMSLEGAPPVRTLLGAGWALARTEVMIQRCHWLARGLQPCPAPAALAQLDQCWLAPESLQQRWRFRH